MKLKILGIICLLVAVILSLCCVSYFDISNKLNDTAIEVAENGRSDYSLGALIGNMFFGFVVFILILLAPVFFAFAIIVFGPALMFFNSGILLLRFDRIKKLDFIKGYIVRKRQNSFIVASIVLYSICAVACTILAVFGRFYFLFVPLFGLIISVCMFKRYVKPFRKLYKYFKRNDVCLPKYIENKEKFTCVSPDNPILISDDTILFTELMCVIPIKHILSFEQGKGLKRNNVQFVLHDLSTVWIPNVDVLHISEAIYAAKAMATKEYAEVTE